MMSEMKFSHIETRGGERVAIFTGPMSYGPEITIFSSRKVDTSITLSPSGKKALNRTSLEVRIENMSRDKRDTSEEERALHALTTSSQ